MKVTFEEKSKAERGAPRAFDATVTLRPSPDATPQIRLVQVNHPLKVGSAKVYLSGNGYAPVVTVRDGTGMVGFRGPVPSLSDDANYTSTIVIKVPDAAPRQLGLVGTFLPTAVRQPGRGWISIFPDKLNPRLVLTAFAAKPGQDGLGVNSGMPQSVYVLDVGKLIQLRTATGQPAQLLLAPGQSATLPEGAGSITFDGVKRYAGLDVHSDPSRGWVLGTSLLALAGLTASLFIRRRRLWIRVSGGAALDDGSGDSASSVVEIAGVARGRDAGLASEVKAALDGVVEQNSVVEQKE